MADRHIQQEAMHNLIVSARQKVIKSKLVGIKYALYGFDVLIIR